MILPSNGETPQGDDDVPKKKRKPKGGAPEGTWWNTGKEEDVPEEEDESAGEDFEDEEEDPGDESPPGFGGATSSVYSPAGPGWRQQLKREILACIDDLKEIEDPDQDFDPPEPPDLYTFFGELAALRHELRVNGRRSAQGMEKTGNALEEIAGLLQEAARQNSAVPPRGGWPVEACLSLIALYDLVSASHPAETARVSFETLFSHAGLERVVTEDRPFDPERMTVAAVEPSPDHPPRVVLRETEAGFLRNGVLLRPARVVISG